MEQFARAPKSFQQLRQKYGQLPDATGDRLILVSVPEYETSSTTSRTYRIFVPQEGSWDLLVEFAGHRGAILEQPNLFLPPVGKRVPLPSGEVTISLRCPREADTQGSVELNGAAVFSFQYREPAETARSTSKVVLRQPLKLQNERPIRLIWMSVGRDIHGNQEGIQLTLTPQGATDTQ